MSDDSHRSRALLRTLLVSDLVGSTQLVEKLGDEAVARLFSRHDSLARGLLSRHQGQEIDKTDGFLLLFRRPIRAVLYALDYHQALAELSRESGAELAARVGIHLGEVVVRENPPQEVAQGAKPMEVEGLAKPMAARLMSVAERRQTLLTRGALEMARRAAVDKLPADRQVRWVQHGLYRFKGVEEPVEVFEVGVEGFAPLKPPADSEKVEAVSGAPSRAQPGRRQPLWIWLAAAALAAALLLVAWWSLSRSSRAARTDAIAAESSASDGRKMIVVLPFENLGPADDEYFAEGITEEITGRLAMISGLGVISRASAAKYANINTSTREIGDELGVGYVLRGSIRWSARPGQDSRVRVTPRLIRVSDDTQFWSPVYDRVIEDIFSVQSEIAATVAEEMGVTLLQPERGSIAAKPTQDIGAYQAFLRGQSYKSQPLSEETQLMAAEMLYRAVDMDPEFTLAWASLVHVHALVHFNVWNPAGEHLAKARAALERAQELQADNPAVWIAAGYFYYYGRGEYDRAAREFERVAEAMPGDTSALVPLALVRRRQGRVEEAVGEFVKAQQLDPLNSKLLDHIAETYQALRSYQQADDYWRQAIAVAPDQELLYARRAENLVRWRGATGEARALLEAAPGRPSLAQWGRLDFVNLDYLDRDFKRVQIELSSEQSLKRVKGFLLAGMVQRLSGEAAAARTSFEAAAREAAELIQGAPDAAILHSALGLAHAFLGQREQAVREAETGAEMLAGDAYSGPLRQENLAAVYAWVGEEERAVKLLADLLQRPYQRAMSVPMLKLDPLWDPLRDNPRFRRLLDAS